MSITIDLPPAMMQETQSYTDLTGTRIGKIFLDTNIFVYVADDADPIKQERANGCTEFWSEDLADGQTYDGIKVVNPFQEAGDER